MNEVLIVEDNPDNLALIEFILHKEGYTTRAATTGTAGVEQALSQDFAFIILDIQLPEMEGTEVLKKFAPMRIKTQSAKKSLSLP